MAKDSIKDGAPYEPRPNRPKSSYRRPTRPLTECGSTKQEERQSNLQQRGARKTLNGASGLSTSLLCETHSSGVTRREKSLLTAPVRIIVVISVVGDLLPTTPVGLDRPDLTIGSGVVDKGYPLT